MHLFTYGFFLYAEGIELDSINAWRLRVMQSSTRGNIEEVERESEGDVPFESSRRTAGIRESLRQNQSILFSSKSPTFRAFPFIYRFLLIP